jgi:hypothetical protein
MAPTGALETARRLTARDEIHKALADLSRRPELDLTGAVHHAMAASPLHAHRQYPLATVPASTGGTGMDNGKAKQSLQRFVAGFRMSVETLGGASQEHRSHPRYPINVEVSYELIVHGKVVETGHGRTVNISTGGVLFESQRPLAPEMGIRLSIAWPAQLGDAVGLTLRVSGRTIRVQENCTAVKTQRYDFRTRALSVGASGGSFD